MTITMKCVKCGVSCEASLTPKTQVTSKLLNYIAKTIGFEEIEGGYICNRCNAENPEQGKQEATNG